MTRKNAVPPMHCAWCGRYIAEDTEMTCWRTRERIKTQNPSDPWNYYCRHLCASCSKAASVRTRTWEPVTVTQVAERGRPTAKFTEPGEDPPVDDRFITPERSVDPEQETPPRLRESVLQLTEKDTT